MANEHCEFIKQDDSSCGAYAGDNSKFCFAHDPTREKERLEAVTKGGYSKKGDPLPPIQLKTFQDVHALIESSVNDVRMGRLSSADGNTVVRFIKCWLNTTGIK